MKTTFKSNGSFLVKLKNFWFAAQLLIISFALPGMCFFQIAHSAKDVNSKQQEEVIKSSDNNNQIIGSQSEAKTVKLS